MTDAEPCPARATADEIDLRLTDGWIKDHAKTCRVPLDVDRIHLAKGTRDAVRVFLDAVPDRVVREEVEALRCAASKRDADKTAKLLAQLSQRTSRLLACRRLRFVDTGIERVLTFPTPPDVLAAATRNDALERLKRFTTFGGYWGSDGQKRKGGQRPQKFHHYLFAPRVQKKNGPPVNDVAVELALNMRLAFLGAHNQGREPPRTSDSERTSYFAQFFGDVLLEIGIPTREIDPVGAILAFDRKRKVSGKK